MSLLSAAVQNRGHSTDYTFESNGKKISGRLWVPKITADRKPAIVVTSTGDGKHGMGSPTWGPVIDGLLSLDLAVFIFDYSGLGSSEGNYADLTVPIGVQNLRDAANFASTLEEIDHKRMGGLGSSFGGTCMLVVQGLHSPFRCIGLKSPAPFIPEAYENEHSEEDFERWKKEGVSPINGARYKKYLDGFQYNVYALAQTIKCPTRIIHGDADSVVPRHQIDRLLRIMDCEKALRLIPGAGHGYKHNHELQQMVQEQVAFFSEQFPRE